MDTNKKYKHLLVVILSLLCCYSHNLFAQMKVGSNPSQLNSNSAFEIESGNKGLLLPRLELHSTTTASPLNNFVKGMLVYNTNTENDITPGLYYSDGTKWVKSNSQESSGSNFWSVNGNSNITANNFLGTIDNAALRFKTNNIERLRITGNGWIGIGTATPSAALQVKGQVVIDSLSTGNTSTDNILVASPLDGRVKKVSASNFVSGVQKRTEIVAIIGQTIFNTPRAITDINKILMYRNGVMISFSMNNTTSIISELPCVIGDEIRIVQFL